MQRRTFTKLASAAAVAWPFAARADSYPSKPVSIVVPYPAGGPTDTLTRLLAEQMQKSLGKTVMVDNVTGASGAVGVLKAARAAPDGYTVSVGHAGSHITIWPMQQAGSFDLLRDMEPVVMFAANPLIIDARRTMEATDLAAFLAYIKANPGKVSMGVAYGTVGHIAGLLLQHQLGASLLFVPYRGGAPAMQDLVAGQIDMLIDQAANSLPQIRSGKIRAYAVTDAKRLAAAADIPTVDEAGLPGFHASIWHALWVPKGTPAAIIDRLNLAAREALASTALQQRFADLGQDIPPAEQQTRSALAEHQKAEVERWTPLLKAANFKSD